MTMIKWLVLLAFPLLTAATCVDTGDIPGNLCSLNDMAICSTEALVEAQLNNNSNRLCTDINFICTDRDPVCVDPCPASAVASDRSVVRRDVVVGQ